MHPLQSSNSQCATQNITHSASFRFAFTGPFPRLSFSGFFFSSPSFSTLHCSAPLFLSFPISTQCKCVFVTHSPLANGFVCNSFTSMGFFWGGGCLFCLVILDLHLKKPNLLFFPSFSSLVCWLFGFAF